MIMKLIMIINNNDNNDNNLGSKIITATIIKIILTMK